MINQVHLEQGYIISGKVSGATRLSFLLFILPVGLLSVRFRYASSSEDCVAPDFPFYNTLIFCYIRISKLHSIVITLVVSLGTPANEMNTSHPDWAPSLHLGYTTKTVTTTTETSRYETGTKKTTKD